MIIFQLIMALLYDYLLRYAITSIVTTTIMSSISKLSPYQLFQTFHRY